MNKSDLAKSIEAKSDQIDADNLISGAIDVTIKAVQRGPSNEQPLQLVLEETDKFYRPSKTYRRALIGCFGDEPANWIGKRLRLVRNPDTMFGGVKVGGVEVSHASIEAPMVFMLQAKRGKKSAVSIDVLTVQKPPAKPKDAAAPPKPHAKGTVTGNADEGDLTGIGEPAGDAFVDKVTQGKIINGFASIGFNLKQLEDEFGKGMDQWLVSDVPYLRQLLSDMKADAAAARQQAADMAQPDAGIVL